MSTRLELLLEMLKSDPHDSFLNYGIALEHIKTNNSAEAIRIMEEVLKKDDQYLPAYYQLGMLYEQNNKTESALEIYNKGIKIAQEKKDLRTLSELKENVQRLT